MMLAGVSVAVDSVAELARIVRPTGGGELADRLERALPALDHPTDGLAELRGVQMNEHDKALEAAGLGRLRFHDLRHTYASLLIAEV